MKGPVAAGGGNEDLVHLFAGVFEEDGQGVIGLGEGEGYFLVCIADEMEGQGLRAVGNVKEGHEAVSIGFGAFCAAA